MRGDFTGRIVARPGWAHIPAVRDGALPEIKSALIRRWAERAR